MKKNLLRISLLFFAFLFSTGIYAQRYLTEIFSSVTVQSNVVYGNNFSYLGNPSAPVAVDLKMDVYTPVGDAVSNRPLVIMIHTGSFGPAIFNQTPTGDMRDSAIAEICRQFARRGYVAASMDYRLGWNPNAIGANGQDIRTGSLLQAVYRAIQDAKACVRFFKNDFVVNANSFGIDTSKIILGGMGSGGYVALAYATLKDSTQFNIPKFICGIPDTTYHLVAGSSYINTGLWGDLDGYGGDPTKNNPNNTPGYSPHVSFVFNCGGALGDSTWLLAGAAPMVCFHPVSDPFAPYVEGIVIVPTTGDPVVEVIGSYSIIRRANGLGNNDCFRLAGFADPYTQAANAINDGYDGLYPFQLPGPQAGPWEWWDSTSVVQYAIAVGLGSAAGNQIHQNGLQTNPNMSKTKGLAYIDTIQNYVNPRIAMCLNLLPGVAEYDYASKNILVYPNPATDRFTLLLKDSKINISKVELEDIAGRTIWIDENLSGSVLRFDSKHALPGTYMLRITTNKGIYLKKINLQ